MASFTMVHIYGYKEDHSVKDLGRFTTAAVEGDTVTVFPGNHQLMKLRGIPHTDQAAGEPISIRKWVWDYFPKGSTSKRPSEAFAWFEVTTVDLELR